MSTVELSARKSNVKVDDDEQSKYFFDDGQKTEIERNYGRRFW